MIFYRILLKKRSKTIQFKIFESEENRDIFFDGLKVEKGVSFRKDTFSFPTDDYEVAVVEDGSPKIQI